MLEELTNELLEKKGFTNQTIIAIEELSELQKELCKALRNKLNINNLIEEVADVEIMLFQIKKIFNIKQEQVDTIKMQKIERTKNKIKNN
jgi:protein tyrosine phosphatase